MWVSGLQQKPRGKMTDDEVALVLCACFTEGKQKGLRNIPVVNIEFLLIWNMHNVRSDSNYYRGFRGL
jgi:hypothetical protein